MRRVVLFGEDVAHEAVLRALVCRLAREAGVVVDVACRSVRGGHGRMIRELRQYVAELQAGQSPLPDLFLVVRDANCRGLAACKAELEGVMATYSGLAICAIPDPHIERWLLLDSAAFKEVFGQGCDAPNQKCNRDRYKELLQDAIRESDIEPLLGGAEYAEDIVEAMNLNRMKSQPDLGRVIQELSGHIQKWKSE